MAYNAMCYPHDIDSCMWQVTKWNATLQTLQDCFKCKQTMKCKQRCAPMWTKILKMLHNKVLTCKIQRRQIGQVWMCRGEWRTERNWNVESTSWFSLQVISPLSLESDARAGVIEIISMMAFGGTFMFKCLRCPFFLIETASSIQRRLMCNFG